MKDPNFVAALEKAIAEKYGQEATVNPAGNWNTEKETKYLQEVKDARKNEAKNESSVEYLDLDGVLIPKKLINKNSNRQCTLCKVFSFNRDDDIYLTKYSSCEKCYIKNIEGREHKWQKSS